MTESRHPEEWPVEDPGPEGPAEGKDPDQPDDVERRDTGHEGLRRDG